LQQQACDFTTQQKAYEFVTIGKHACNIKKPVRNINL
jgi:hypothetical protein